MLRDAVAAKMPIVAEADRDPNAQALAGFPVTSKWRTLKPLDEPVPEPQNAFFCYAPTEDPDNLPTLPKQNFGEVFARPDFTGKSGKDKKEVRREGELCYQFILDEGLTLRSHPVQWVEAFMPVSGKAKGSSSVTPHVHNSDTFCL